MPTEEELKQQEVAKKAEEEKKQQEEERLKKEKEEEEKLEKMAGDKDVVKSLLEAKRKANAEARELRLKLEAIATKQSETEKKALEEQGKFKELAEKEKTEKETLEKVTKQMMIDHALQVEAMTLNIIDIDGVKLADTSKITIDSEYKVEGAKEAVEALKESKPYLFKEKEGDGEETSERGGTPNIRGKLKETQEGLTPDQRISKYYQGKRK